jgi:serine/threonine-protein kinase SRPK3
MVADVDATLANWVDKHTVDVIEPIALRAPEVILGAEWGPSAEIWGLGCVVSHSLVHGCVGP